MSPSTPKSEPSYRGQRRTKRLKIDVACDTCRNRKVKCDGVRPACGNCSKRLEQREKCRYSNSDGSLAIPAKHTSMVHGEKPSSVHQGHTLPHEREYGSHLPHANSQPVSQDRHVRLTPQLQSFRPVLPSPSPNQPPVDAKPLVARVQRSAAPSDMGTASSQHASPTVIDSMTAVVDDGANTGEFFGSSSAGSFTAQIKAAVANRIGQGQPKTHQFDHRGVVANLNAPRRLGTYNSASDVLPPRRQADRLMNAYWFYVDPLYPFLDRRNWEQNYANLFSGTTLDTDEAIFVATLNVIFALSTQLEESMEPEKRDEMSNVYFKRARDLVDHTFCESGSLELVQHLLLMSQYLQSTSLPHQTWMIVGSAVRVAQSLGLQLPETSAAQPTPAQRELLRRLWHGCVLMDRMVSLTHGRPTMITKDLASAVPLPMTSADGGPEESGHLTEASFFVKSVELYEITNRVIDHLYSEPGLSQRSRVHIDKQHEDLTVVMQLDAAMMRWEKSLPRFLVLSGPIVELNHVSYRQAVILNIRFLHARMLLLRPVVARVCIPTETSEVATPRGSDSLQTRVMQQCAICCVAIARNIISLLLKYQAYDGTVGFLPAWWYRVYYLFSAATVLIAAKLRADIFDPEEINQAWSEVMKVLQVYEHVSQSARRCVAALQILSSKILSSLPSSGTSRAFQIPLCSSRSGGMEPPVRQSSSVMRDQSFAQFPELDIRDLTFTVNDFSWLNDMNAWHVLNDT